ncbi:C-type lectin domain family 4 member E-like [Clarias gariepinus]|uniref:C-type lectin domain family 4 member E-like n=1 Tax=Clarias gariepinus TaxID=13013 RepID=UPI00234C8FCA|nr:C-type lectin domain family 4 member E-like [Clarias gariepinus]
MLCLLLTAVIVLWIKYPNLKTGKETCNNNLTIARDQFQRERDQLQRERDELQRFSKLGWNYFSSSVYIIITEKKSWTESRENCRGTGADLVIITSKEEQEFVNKLRGGGQAWIGLSNRENKWKWVDDTTLITGFWEDKEPNSAAGHEGCVVTGIKSDPVKNWAEYPCNKEYNWICKKKIFN